MSRINCFMLKGNHWKPAVVGMMLLICVGCGGRSSEPPVRSINPFPLPEFELPTPDGDTFSSERIRGRISLINFWSSWSPSAIRQARDLVELNNRYSEQGLFIVGIAIDHGSTTEDIRSFIAHSDLNYPVAIADRDFHNRFGGIDAIPTTFIVDPSGKVINRYTGVALPDELNREIQHLLLARESERE